MKIPLDPHSPVSTFLLGIALGGGDALEVAKNMVENQDEDEEKDGP